MKEAERLEIDIITLFPEVFEKFLSTSIVGIAQKKGVLTVRLHNLRDWGKGKRRNVDDRPFGGGAGMLIMPDVVVNAVEEIDRDRTAHTILLTPSGRLFNQKVAEELIEKGRLLIICGHYEGIDERASVVLGADEVSIGDFVTTGGEAPAMVIVDTLARLLPNVLGNESSVETESFSNGLLEHPHYTRPREFRGLSVPEVLLSGNHAEIAKWRHIQSLKKTKERRPDLFEKYIKEHPEEEEL